jgi:heavy metal sensor kinase
MRFAPSSVRARLTLWHAGVLALLVCVFSAGIFALVRTWLSQSLDEQIDRDLATVEKVYREETGDLGELADRVGITLFEVVEGAKVIYRTPRWPPSGTTPYRVRTVADASHHVSVARDEGPIRQTLRILLIVLGTAAPAAIVVAIGCGHFLAGRVLAPVGAMAEAARAITADSLEARLPVDNPADEFGRLASVFNDTLARLHDAFAQLRRFTADASHELRTPLTAMRSVGEVALQRSLDVAGYREVVGSLLEEVDRLSRLVENLLTLTRAEAGRVPLAPAVVDLDELARSVAEHLRVLADEKHQVLRVDASAHVTAACDPGIVRQGLINLLHNAITYTPGQGSIRVVVRETASGDAAIEVTDTGPGIAPRHHGRIFERFYRPDAARTRETGGVGLGLAIARWAVEANGGRIELESAEGRGSLFRIVLPRGRGRAHVCL